jgi:hypothetical protein
MERALIPFVGLGEVLFGMKISEVQKLVNVRECKITNRHLDESRIFADKVAYVFIGDILAAIELEYQDGIVFNGIDIFNLMDVDEILQGLKFESKKDNIHVKEQGLILIDFRKKNKQKRTIWFYSAEMVTEYECFLDVV